MRTGVKRDGGRSGADGVTCVGHIPLDHYLETVEVVRICIVASWMKTLQGNCEACVCELVQFACGDVDLKDVVLRGNEVVVHEIRHEVVTVLGVFEDDVVKIPWMGWSYRCCRSSRARWSVARRRWIGLVLLFRLKCSAPGSSRLPSRKSLIVLRFILDLALLFLLSISTVLTLA